MKKAYGATGTGVSGDPGVNTRSGWTPAKKRYVQATDQVMEQADEMGHKLRENSSLDNGVPGRSQASHAAKQTSVADPNMGGAVSKDMCDGCQDWYQDRATSTQEPLVVEDPSVVRVFHTDGAIDVYSR
jgi:hypothetical protein